MYNGTTLRARTTLQPQKGKINAFHSLHPIQSPITIHHNRHPGHKKATPQDSAYQPVRRANHQFIRTKIRLRKGDFDMKYTRQQFDETLRCFDVTIKVAKSKGAPVDFICTAYGMTACPRYCPRYSTVDTSRCDRPETADRWQSLKEQFIIENEPED